MRFAAAIVFLVLAAGAANAQAPLGLSVQAAPRDVIREMCDEADAIWRRAHVTLQCRSDAASSAVRVIFDVPPAAQPGRPIRIGWILFAGDVPEPTIHLSYENALQLLDDSGTVVGPLKAWERDTLVARALGRALAHELGHYLLGSKAHTAGGLMRAQRQASEMFERSRAGWLPNLGRCAERLFASFDSEHQTFGDRIRLLQTRC
jgi:hypothetical protein